MQQVLAQMSLEELNNFHGKIKRATVGLQFSLIPHNNQTFDKTVRLLHEVESELNKRRPGGGMNIKFHQAQLQG